MAHPVCLRVGMPTLLVSFAYILPVGLVPRRSLLALIFTSSRLSLRTIAESDTRRATLRSSAHIAFAKNDCTTVFTQGKNELPHRPILIGKCTPRQVIQHVCIYVD